jgi:hypothetical protein
MSYIEQYPYTLENASYDDLMSGAWTPGVAVGLGGRKSFCMGKTIWA